MESTQRLDVESIAVETFATMPETRGESAPRDRVVLDAEALAATSRPVRPPYCTC